jgi:RimJ/RimL family protein N-acetyltransferase
VNLVSDPEELAALFQRDREAHIYGLADLEEPYWSSSRWFAHGEAAVGIVSVGDDWATGYAMSRVAPDDTLQLLAKLETEIPSATWITGPAGLFAFLSARRRTRDIGSHWRMVLEAPPPADESVDVVALTASDVDALTDLHASDPGRSFFLPGMLERNPFFGIWEDGRLVASAGTHVVSRRYGVAAVGAVITRPSHRGKGLGTLATAALCTFLYDDYETIGLNVETANEAALRVYERIGFRRVFEYEEVEVL